MDEEKRKALEKMIEGDSTYGNPFHPNCAYMYACRDLLFENDQLRKENDRLRAGEPLRDIPGVFS